MNKTELIKQLKQLAGNDNLLLNEPMSGHTTFKIGGPAEIFVIPHTQFAFRKIIQLLNENSTPYFILGSGSNLVVSDKGIKGVVIYTKLMTTIRRSHNKITAGCGADMSNICHVAANSGLSGLEFACGIPGTLGGAVYMNAGAYESEMSKVVLFSKVIDTDVNVIKTLKWEDHKFSYRHSVFHEHQYIHISSTLLLKPLSKYIIQSKMRELTQAREDKQPLDMPSAGSVFRRPEGHYTGKLIEECGLKGFHIGGAEVSTKHCGFIVNKGNATAQDVKALIAHIQKTIFDKYGVMLQTEIKFIGEE